MTTATSSLGHMPAGPKWEFDADVTRVFDDMLTRSIPQYDVMRQACFELACRYRRPKEEILDLGCSRGDAIAELVQKFGATNHYLGVDISAPMLAACRERFKGVIDAQVVRIMECDLRKEHPHSFPCVTLSVLCLQFTPIEYRQQIVQRIYDHLKPGGAFILVEKILGQGAELDDAMVENYYRFKAANGYSEEEIARKRLSLEGVLVPLTARANECLLDTAGFRRVDCFWRWMNFAGWVAIK